MVIWFTGQPGSGKTTLATEFYNRLISYTSEAVVHLDGDDLREVLDNKDYSEKGRRKNIQFAINMTRVLDDKGFIVIVSMVSPYRDQREKLKSNRNITEFYLHTTEIRGKEDYFVDGYEPPLHNFTDINTDKTIEESVDEIFDVYRQMATLA